jgi:prefoldin subunit 5
MAQQAGLTAEMYQAVIAVVDDRMQAISVTRQDYDRLEHRMERVEAALERLAEAQARTEERLNQLVEAQARTEERLDRLEATVEKLAEAQTRTEEQIQDLVQVVTRLESTQAGMKGNLLELTYQRRAGSYLGPVLRRVRAWVPFELEEELEPRLPRSDYLDLLRTDLLMRGQPRDRLEMTEVWLAVEVSAVVDRGDVERAVRRAGHLRKAGYVALPAVAGEQATEGAEDMAQREGALMILDGSIAFWEEALNQALAA